MVVSALLDQHSKVRSIEILEHPTCDLRPVPDAILAAAAADISRLLSERRAVVLMDSGGVVRTGQVCAYVGAIGASHRIPP